MNNGNWKSIWNNRTASQEKIDLETLIRLDGFDHGAGKIETASWRKYATLISKNLNLVSGQSVFEVGCGSGAMLFALCEQRRIEVGGIDYSTPLIEAARKAIPHGIFFCGDASTLSSPPQYDHVISNSVFQYFTLTQAETVLDLMLTKARRCVYILDVPSAEKKSLSEEIRRAALSEDEYREKYANLNHSYYEHRWFKDIANKHRAKCYISSGFVPGYQQNSYRFSCLIEKSIDD